jgi:hypothetical protein
MGKEQERVVTQLTATRQEEHTFLYNYQVQGLIILVDQHHGNLI